MTLNSIMIFEGILSGEDTYLSIILMSISFLAHSNYLFVLD
jgi:hypothetical protein